MNASTCRACLKETCESKINKIRTRRVALMFQTVTGYSIDKSEPQNLCKQCFEDLLVSYSFKKRCDETQAALEKLVTKVETIVEVKEEKQELEIEQVDDISFEIVSEVDAKPESEPEEYEDYEAIDDDPDYQSPVKQTDQQCLFCDQTFKTKKGFNAHLNDTHTEFLTATCTGCNKPQLPQLLDEHHNKCDRYSRKQQVVCSFCGIFLKKAQLQKHVHSLHGDPNLTFECDLCHAKVRTKASVVSHMRNLHLPPSWKCKECGEVFKSNSGLLRHRRIAHVEKYGLLSCKYCDFKTTTHSNLRCHTLAHIGEPGKNHKCPHCNMKFYQKHQLNSHLATHTNDRPFVCSTCGGAYKTQRALNVHLKIHREHDYECPVCGRTFLTNQMMRNHCFKEHPDYTLPPSGTVMNKTWLKKFGQENVTMKFLPVSSFGQQQ